MTEYTDGSQVLYAGASRNGLEIGDCGLLLTTAGRGAHVQWTSGLRRNAVTLEDIDDLVPATEQRVAVATPTSSDGLEDSLEVGAPNHVSLAHLCALQGPGAVLATITQNHSSDFAAISREVQAFTEQRVTVMGGIRQVIAVLDEEEGAELIRLAAQAVIQHTFGSTRD